MASLDQVVCERIAEATGQSAELDGQDFAGGGCINDARVLRLRDGRRFFLKTNPAPLPGMFEREAEGLEALAAAGTIRVTRPVATGGREDGVAPFIVMEHIESGSPGRDFHETFGRQFAQLHRAATHDRYGFGHDNYLGSTPQPNTWREDWVEFWREHRLGHQLRLARANGYSDSKMDQLGDRLMERLEEIIGEPNEGPCLLHGDLWGGNYLADADGRPVLIDPAAYYGRREADLAMTYLFGGFNARFYRAYEESWPLAEGSAERIEIYKLYHLMNHLNLFGGGYYSGCMSILKRFG